MRRGPAPRARCAAIAPSNHQCHSTAGSGSRSRIIRSGRSSWSRPPGEVQYPPSCTSPISAGRSSATMYQDDPLSSGITTRPISVWYGLPCICLIKTLPLCPSDSGPGVNGRPSRCGENQSLMDSVILPCELGDALLGEQQPRSRDSGDTTRPARFLQRQHRSKRSPDVMRFGASEYVCDSCRTWSGRASSQVVHE